MPTPFTHLALAATVLDGEGLPRATAQLLRAQRGPFLLGNTAPDVQTVSGQDRFETHFYTLPPTSDAPAQDTLFDAYPELAQPAELPLAHAAFIAGYLAHLALDELWLEQVFVPFYRESSLPWTERVFQHNLLRAWVDRQDQARLDGGVAVTLQETMPEKWLPFVKDEDLVKWRDWLVEQLQPGQRAQTTNVFAQRMGISVAEMETVLASPAQMDDQVFRRIPADAMRAFQKTGLECTAETVTRYLIRNPKISEEYS